MQNNPLIRKNEPSLTSGLHVTSARLNQRSNPQVREARQPPPPRFSKKVFQSNCNVAAAGDPRAKLGSYSQAYGTINKTDLDNLLRGRPCNHRVSFRDNRRFPRSVTWRRGVVASAAAAAAARDPVVLQSPELEEEEGELTVSCCEINTLKIVPAAE
ncbi:Mitogen-activated protein kinase 15 [Larimichthys crocea]|uniref:Uncharacterized protein n=1 Tax=Larimichthys crocea TaxID=215358 RepID=A0ACD3RE48_LARCR|nr:Mitogen-activated protein kinase 15 [Larimichthys crocea]